MAYDEQREQRALVCRVDRQSAAWELLTACTALVDPRIAPVYRAGELGDRVYFASQIATGEHIGLARRNPNQPLIPQLIPWVGLAKAILAVRTQLQLRGHFDIEFARRTSSATVKLEILGLAAAAQQDSDHSSRTPHKSTSGMVDRTLRPPFDRDEAKKPPAQDEGTSHTVDRDVLHYCRALWAFLGDGDAPSAPDMSSQHFRRPCRRHKIPRWLAEALHAGLSPSSVVDGDKFFLDIISLLEGRIRRRFFQRVLMMGIVGTLCLGFAMFASIGTKRPECQSIAVHWSDATDKVRSFLSEGLVSNSAFEVSAAVLASLQLEASHYLRRGKDLHEAACLAAYSSPSKRSKRTYARQSACFSASAEVAVRLMTSWSSTNPLPKAAHQLRDGLPSLNLCTDVEPPKKGPENEAHAQELASLVAKAELHNTQHQFARARNLAGEALEQLDHVGEDPLAVRARITRARALNALGDSVSARQDVDRAFRGAEALRHPDLRLRAAVLRAKILLGQGYVAESQTQMLDARALSQREDVPVEARLEFLSKACLVDRRTLDLCTSLHMCEEGVELLKKHPVSPATENELHRRVAWLHYEAGDVPAAFQASKVSRQRLIQSVGKDSPLTLEADSLHVSLWAELLRVRGASAPEYESLSQFAQRLESRFVRTYGQESPLVLVIQCNFAEILRRASHYTRARVLYEQILAGFPEDSQRYFALVGYAKTLSALGEQEKAMEVLRQALVDIDSHAASNPDLPEKAEALVAIAELLGPTELGQKTASQAIKIYRALNQRGTHKTCHPTANHAGLYAHEQTHVERWLQNTHGDARPPLPGSNSNDEQPKMR